MHRSILSLATPWPIAQELVFFNEVDGKFLSLELRHLTIFPNEEIFNEFVATLFKYLIIFGQGL